MDDEVNQISNDLSALDVTDPLASNGVEYSILNPDVQSFTPKLAMEKSEKITEKKGANNSKSSWKFGLKNTKLQFHLHLVPTTMIESTKSSLHKLRHKMITS